MDSRIAESELILPSLFLMSANQGGVITTSELVGKLREIMKPSGEDLEVLAGRSDDKFSQKVRNLTAHRTFERGDLARYVDKSIEITDSGKAYLREKQDILNYLLGNDFSYPDLTKSLRDIENRNQVIEVFDENILIQEGRKRLVKSAVYERSSLLRDYAIRYFSRENSESKLFIELHLAPLPRPI